jgi:CRP/FNR family cyclic AMP-dependent transcriptional regulator
VDYSDFPGAVWKPKKGEFLWQEGEASLWVGYLEAGEVEVVRYSMDGEAAILNVVKPGQLLGEMSALDGACHSASVRARGNVQLKRCTTEDFIHWLRQGDRWLQLVRSLSARLRALSNRFLENSLESVRTRLIRCLLELSTASPTVEITHQELAERLGTTRESVSKSIGELVKLKLIQSKRGRLEILERQSLSELVN